MENNIKQPFSYEKEQFSHEKQQFSYISIPYFGTDSPIPTAPLRVFAQAAGRHGAARRAGRPPRGLGGRAAEGRAAWWPGCGGEECPVAQ